MDLEIKRAGPEDARPIRSTRVASWRAGYRGLISQDYLDQLDPLQGSSELAALLPAFGCALTINVALAEGQCIGFSATGSPRYEAPEGTMELYALYVDPDFWRRRVGGALVNQAIFDAAFLGQQGIGLWCLKGNDRATRFYESAGFKLGGQERTTHELTGMPLTEVEYLLNFLGPRGGTA